MDNNEVTNKGSKVGVGIGIAVVAIAAVVAVAAMGGKHDDAAMTTTTDTTATMPAEQAAPETTPGSTTTTGVKVTTPPTKTTMTATPRFHDGTYSATGSYMSPGGMDQLAVTLTLKDDKITDATVVSKAGDNTSARYQQMFIDGYKSYVIGKDISSVSLDKVSGSSLTPKGFNDALIKIEAEAKA